MKLLLVAINAKSIHKALAPWCMKAYLDEQTGQSVIETAVLETSINEPFLQLLAAIIREQADVVAFSCYIWNITLVKQLGAEIKKIVPHSKIFLGGPEVSFESDNQALPFCDTLLFGEGEKIIYEAMCAVQAQKPQPSLSAEKLDFDALPSPYTDSFFASFAAGGMRHIANQMVYIETARGCPFSCAYCLSSATVGVSFLSLEKVFTRLDVLVEKGARVIKFVDRTFNANQNRAAAILQHIAAYDTNCVFHMEISADLLDEPLFSVIASLPVGRVQFEIGVQTATEKVLQEICRKTDTALVLQNIARLSALGNCHIHADLIAGLPYETPESFALSLNAVLTHHPHVLQLGFLKLLKGSAIRERAEQYQYIYLDFPPYEVLAQPSMSFSDLTMLKGIERAVDKFYNTGMFALSVSHMVQQIFASDFYAFFLELSVFCSMQESDVKFSLKNAYTILSAFMCQYMDSFAVAHYIKLDCMLSDPKGMLPDWICPMRDKAREQDCRRMGKGRNLRAEYFPFDATTRLFSYDEKNPVTNRFTCTLL